MKTASLLVLAVTAVLAGSAWSTPSISAASTTFEVQLSGANEVPPVTSPAAGEGRFTFNDTTNVLTYSLTASGVSPNLVTAAHIHRGAAGTNGPIIYPLATSGFSVVSGSITLTAQDVADLRAGNLYVNMHTTDHPGGAARAQLLLPAAPSGAAVFQATDAQNGQTVAVPQGQVLQVVLQTTFWTFADPNPAGILATQGTPAVVPAPRGTCLPGVGCGTVTATYLAATPGTARVGASRTSCGEALRCTPEQSSYTLNVVVTAPGSSSITPPSAGDAGLRSGSVHGVYGWVALAGAVGLAAAWAGLVLWRRTRAID